MEELKHTTEPRKEIKKIADENFSRWNNALLTRNPAEIVKLYAEDATFLPTVSSEFKKGQSGAETYFKHFLGKNPIGKIIQDEIQDLGLDCYLHSGMYNFEIDSDDNKQIVEARFSFVWKWDQQGGWRIIHHHSSIKPKE